MADPRVVLIKEQKVADLTTVIPTTRIDHTVVTVAQPPSTKSIAHSYIAHVINYILFPKLCSLFSNAFMKPNG